MDFLEGLNPQQREAVSHVEGPLLLLAGAGSGKTRVITHRIARLVDHHRIPGPCVLAVTFTNKGADEMRQRVNSLLGDPARGNSPLVSTFHSFCVRMLRRDGAHLADIREGFTTKFTIYDADDQVSLLRSIYRSLGLDDKFMPYRSMVSWISHSKSKKTSPTDVARDSTDPKTSRMAKIYDDYETRLRQANALDFDDLLLESVRLLEHDTQLREQLSRRFEFLMIDEYQDTNRSQYELMRLLTCSHQNIAVVGDEDQSIYGWRGADIRNILDFERDYPKAAVIRLEQNYRSTKNILDAASAVVANNTERKGKWLWTEAGEGPKIGMYEAIDGENEALFIADTVEKVLTRNPDYRVAVLYRTNFQSRQIEEALRRYGRKYLVVGGFSFYQRAEVKDILCYLKVLQSPNDSIALLRVINTPARGIGKTTIEQMEQYALEHGVSVWTAIGQMIKERAFPARAESALRGFHSLIEELAEELPRKEIHELLTEILEKTGYQKMLETDKDPEAESRLGNLSELVNAAAEAAERGEGLTEFLDHAALVADSDDLDMQSQVSLLTMHNAKGLEFPVVFIAGMEEGLFPHTRSFDSLAGMEEERRLCYVGMTRAEKQLYLSWAKFRRRFGGGSPERAMPSRFLKEVPRGLTENLREDDRFHQVDLFAERHEVREVVKKNLYTGKTYNSIENINQFFAEKGLPTPSMAPQQPKQAPPKTVSTPARPPGNKKPFGAGSSVTHPKYGRGMVLRREGEGEDAKLTVSFPGYGLKKLVEKYAGIKAD